MRLLIVIGALVGLSACGPLPQMSAQQAAYASVYNGYEHPYPAYYYQQAYQQPQPTQCILLGGVVLKCH